MARASGFVVVCLLAGTGCHGEGSWTLLATIESDAEQGLRADLFADDCSAVFQQFQVHFASAQPIDDAGASGGDLGLASPAELSDVGPHVVAVIDILAGDYEKLDLTFGDEAAPALALEGLLTCSSGTVQFAWSVPGPLHATCDGVGLSIDKNGDGESLVAFPGTGVFSPVQGSVAPPLLGKAIIASDENHDGDVTMDELNAVALADAAGGGYEGSAATLGELVDAQMRTLVRDESGQPCSIGK